MMAQASVEMEVHRAMARLTSAEARAARALLSDYPTLGLAPVAEFAAASATSSATVLRFVGQLGFESYPDFQRRLREELSERIKSPLEKTRQTPKRAGQGAFLPRFAEALAENLRETAARIPAPEFEAVCARIADKRHACHVVGGRFTDALAAYFVAHLRVVRPGVRKLEEHAANRTDQILDIGAQDTVIIFDIRRYDDDLARLAAVARQRKALVILLTDTWISPASRYARYVLPAAINLARTWDSSASLMAIVEAIIARVTERSWKDAKLRMQDKEALSPNPIDEAPK